MEIVEYKNARDLTVKFLDEYGFIAKHRTWNEFKIGSIINPYYKSVYNRGFLGTKYPSRISGKHTLEYVVWHSMFVRCYSDLSNSIRPTYNDSYVDELWFNYENFYEWINSQNNFKYFDISDKCQLDKDILEKHNKEYSYSKCLLVPQNINKLFTKREALRGDLPIGVHKGEYGYIAQCQNPKLGRQKYLGTYSNPEDAFYKYKEYKEKIIKEIALEEYKRHRITEKCLDAMNKYVVEITD